MIRFVSDLHQPRTGYKLPVMEGEDSLTLVVAGDIDDGHDGLSFVEDCCARHKHVVLVLGNHEFHLSEYHETQEFWTAAASRIDNLHVLNPGMVELEGIVFIGATLWTDVNKNDWFSKQRIKNMKDFDGYITVRNKWNGEKRLFNPNDCLSIHEAELHFIKQNLLGCKGKKIVVVSHFAPLPACSAPAFKRDPYYPFFFSDLESVFRDYEFTAWIHGHLHSTVALKDIYGKDVHCNPKGNSNYANETFDPFKTLTL